MNVASANGLHRGAQLHVRHRGDAADVCVGDARDGVAMTPDRLLPWFSCTKLVTAVAVLQLWERGALALDDPVADHVPEFAAAGKGSVTIRHLLTHTAGLALPLGDDPTADTWDDLLAAACSAPLREHWRPGWRAAYDPRGGFHVLGEVVQRVAGRPFADHSSEEVLEPLGMGDSWMALDPTRRRDYGARVGSMWATAPGKQARLIQTYEEPEAFAEARPSSGGIGPARDLVRVPAMLLGRGSLDGERLLTEATVEAATARHRAGLKDETFGAIIDWGLGIMVSSSQYLGRPAPYGYGNHASLRAFGHGGSQSSIAFADPEHDLAVALICNGLPGEPAHHRRTQPVLTSIYEALGLDGSYR
jgi:CubicO group peptidase (beta-lactamase class C family)